MSIKVNKSNLTSKTTDMALKSYLSEYERKDDDLRKKLNQLEGL